MDASNRLPSVGTWTDDNGTIHAEVYLRCECGSTWWEYRRYVQVFKSEHVKGASNAERVADAIRVALWCVSCGKEAPS